MIFHPKLIKMIKFFIGGIFSLSLKLGLTFLLTEIFKMWYFLSYIITLVVVLLYGFFYNAHITFKVTDNKRINFVKFCAITLSLLVLDGFLVKLLTDYFNVYYLISIFVVSIVLFFTRFETYNKFVFKETK